MPEQCNATKNDGDPCEYTAKYDDGKCGIHTNETKREPGRPSEVAKHEDDILQGARAGMTMQGLARLAGVDESTLYRYINKEKNAEFRKSLKRARAHGELQHLQSVNDRGSQFILERSFGYVKTEKREVEMDADLDHSGDVSAEFVTYTGDDGDDE